MNSKLLIYLIPLFYISFFFYPLLPLSFFFLLIIYIIYAYKFLVSEYNKEKITFSFILKCWIALVIFNSILLPILLFSPILFSFVNLNPNLIYPYKCNFSNYFSCVGLPIMTEKTVKLSLKSNISSFFIINVSTDACNTSIYDNNEELNKGDIFNITFFDCDNGQLGTNPYKQINISIYDINNKKEIISYGTLRLTITRY